MEGRHNVMWPPCKVHHVRSQHRLNMTYADHNVSTMNASTASRPRGSPHRFASRFRITLSQWPSTHGNHPWCSRCIQDLASHAKLSTEDLKGLVSHIQLYKKVLHTIEMHQEAFGPADTNSTKFNLDFPDIILNATVHANNLSSLPPEDPTDILGWIK